VLVVEDLHWIDTSSEEFLTFLLDTVAGVPLLLLVTYRIGYTPPFGSRSFYTTLTLRNFSATETLAMAGHVLGTAQFPAEIHTALLDKAEGVPLFIEEVTKALLDLGVLQREDGGYRLVKSLSEVRIPETIQGIIMARLDRLGEDGKRTLQLASVIGRQFLVRLLARVAGLHNRLEGLLRELQALEIIYEQGHVPEPAYIFKHAVIQDVAYQSLLMQRRKALHRAVGEAIEELYQDRLEEHYVELAHHFVQGEVWEKALAYGRQAGEHALARSAHREAVGCFEQALKVFPHLPETRDRREQAIDLRLALRSALLPAGDLERILAVLREAEALAAALGDQRRLGQVSLFLTVHFYQRGAYAQAIRCGQRALELATAEGNRSLQALANQYLGVSYQTQDTVAFLDGARQRERFGQVILPAVYARAFLAWCYAELGLFAEGQAHGEEGLQIVETVDHPGSVMFMAWGRGVGALCHGDVQRALPLLERALSLCHTADLPGFVPRVAPTLGEMYVLCGRVADAVSLLTPALEQTMAAAMVVYQALCHLALGKAQLLAGALEEAQSLAQRALIIARQHREHGNEAYALQLLGEIAAHRAPPDVVTAAAHYEQALTLAEELGMRPLQAHCHRGLGTLYARIGQREQARTALTTAIAMYRDMDMTFWLPEAEEALAQVEGR
jgi:predicted ATPase